MARWLVLKIVVEIGMDGFVHMLIEMTNEPDCRLIGSWFMKAAEAQAFWQESLRNRPFGNRCSLFARPIWNAD
jgi:hypothetical protein